MSYQRTRVVAIGVLWAAFLGGAGSGGFLPAGWGADGGESPPSLPAPYDGAVNVNPEGLTLYWWADPSATSYDVYLGTTPDNLVLAGSTDQPYWTVTTPLTRGECYYWHLAARVGGAEPVDGPMRRFTVSPPLSSDISLLQWYAFDEGAGGVSRCVEGPGSPAEVVQMMWGDPAAPGFDGTSIDSDGFGWAQFSIPATVLPTNRLTLTGWFRVGRQDKPAALWSLGSGARSYVSLVQPPDGGAPILEVQSPGQSQPVTSPMTVPFPMNHWTHLAVVIDGPARQIVVYEDGAEIWKAGGLTGLKSVLDEASDVFLGASFVLDVLLRGGMDEVRLYARRLDAQEVARTMLGHPDSPYDPDPRQWAQVRADVPTTLRWKGGTAATYNLYTGATPDRLDLAAGGLTQTEYSLEQTPAGGQTLYWRVEAVVDDGFIPGPLWQFSTTDQSLSDVIAVRDEVEWRTDFPKYWGQIVPDMSLTDLQGVGHRLRDYRGRHLLVVVWAPWCSTCQAEMTQLSSLRDAISEDELALLTITDESNQNSVATFLAGRPDITFPVCVADMSALPEPFNSVTQFPAVVYVAPDGAVKLGMVGPIPLATIEAVLAATWP